MHLNVIAPPADPIPWVTDQMTRAGVFATNTSDTLRMKAALEVLTRNVSALHDDAGQYRVVLEEATATAGTSIGQRLVAVGSKPLRDKRLTNGQRAAVIMGLVLHEVGHIRFSRQYDAAIAAAGIQRTGAVGAISNLTADHHNERSAMDLFPGLAYAVEVAMWWVAGEMPDFTFKPDTVEGRVNAAIACTRYPWDYDWSQHPEWHAWWADWAARAEVQGSPEQHVALVEEAMAKVRDLDDQPDDDDDDEPDDGEGGDDTPGGDDDEGDDSDDGDTCDDGDPAPGGDDEGDDDDGTPTPSDDEGDDDSSEDGDDDGPTGSDGDEDGDDGDDEQDGKGSGPAPDWSDDTDTDDGDGDGDDGQPGDEPSDDPGDGDADGDGQEGQDGQGTSDGDGDTGSTGGDPTDEDSDGIQSGCSGDTADTEDDSYIQSNIEALLAKERLATGVHHYVHSTSKYGGGINEDGIKSRNTEGRTVVIGKKQGKGFTL